MTNQNSSSKNLLLLGVGVAAGWLMKQLFDSPEVREKRQALMSKVDFKSGADISKVIQEIKGQVLAELRTLDISIDDIDKEKYQEIVMEIVKAAAKDGKLPQNQVDELKSALIEDFSKVHVSKKTPKASNSKKVATK